MPLLVKVCPLAFMLTLDMIAHSWLTRVSPARIPQHKQSCLSNLRKSHCLSSLTDRAIVEELAIVEEWATGHWDLSFVMVNRWQVVNSISKCVFTNFILAFSISSNRINIFLYPNIQPDYKIGFLDKNFVYTNYKHELSNPFWRISRYSTNRILASHRVGGKAVREVGIAKVEPNKVARNRGISMSE